MSTIASHSPLNIVETVIDRGLVPKDHGLRGIQWLCDQWHYVTPKGQSRDSNTLSARYLKNGWR